VPSRVANGWPVAHRQTKTAERYALQGGGGELNFVTLKPFCGTRFELASRKRQDLYNKKYPLEFLH
jgi:hypothetical protein